MRKMIVTAAGIALMTWAGCITVNVYFPAPEVRLAAEQIVDETWGGESAKVPPTPAGGGQSFLPQSWPVFAAAAYAEGVDINVSTAAIRALKDQMKARADQLKPYLSQGKIGIGKDGMLVVRDLDGVALREQASVRRLAAAENSDRGSLYKEIAKANDFGAERVAEVQQIFAETWIAKADPGWWVQGPSGEWKKN